MVIGRSKGMDRGCAQMRCGGSPRTVWPAESLSVVLPPASQNSRQNGHTSRVYRIFKCLYVPYYLPDVEEPINHYTHT